MVKGSGADPIRAGMHLTEQQQERDRKGVRVAEPQVLIQAAPAR
jgi:hypothetical protein